MTESAIEQPALHDWPLRPWALAGLLGLAGLLIHLVTHGNEGVPWRMALAAFLFFGAIAAAFTLDRERWKEPAIFAVVIGLVMAGLAWRAVRYGEYLPDEQYGFAAGVLASALALPLFQAGFLKKRMSTPYADIHYHGWTDAISAAGALAFTGLAWIALYILSQLFGLLKIELLNRLMEQEWFGWTFSGLAFGAALGTLRNELKVLGTLQNVVMLVLSLLAVPLAFGLLVFLLATAVSGPQVLWEATSRATPLLLSCAAGAFLLANAIVRNDDAAMSRSRVMRVAAVVLAAVILPLAVFAAFSMGLRLNQHGFSPERLWGLVAIIVAVACGIVCWVALIRGRKDDWADRLRQSNFHLALGVCAFALLLALPILDFAAISTRNQLARLESGKVTPDQFDFEALRWDFGEPGRRALEELAKGGGETAELATAALAQKARYYGIGTTVRRDADIALRVQPENAETRRLVLDHVRGNPWLCNEACVALDLGPAPGGARDVALVQGLTFQRLKLPETAQTTTPPTTPQQPLTADSVVEIRTLEKRYIFIDGKPLDLPLD